MKLASRKAGGRDGQLVVVDRALTRFVTVPTIAPTLQSALDQWNEVEPLLRDVARALRGRHRRRRTPVRSTRNAQHPCRARSSGPTQAPM